MVFIVRDHYLTLHEFEMPESALVASIIESQQIFQKANGAENAIFRNNIRGQSIWVYGGKGEVFIAIWEE